MPTPEQLTIPDKLDSINVTKQAIRQAIVNKGVEIPDGTTFYEYAGKIDEISSGGGALTFTQVYANEYLSTMSNNAIMPMAGPPYYTFSIPITDGNNAVIAIDGANDWDSLVGPRIFYYKNGKWMSKQYNELGCSGSGELLTLESTGGLYMMYVCETNVDVSTLP